MSCLEKFIFVTLLSLLLFIAPVVAQDELPAILDYYPNCSYHIIDNAKVKVKTEQPFADKTRLSLLKKLRRKAQSLGADNLILIDKKVIKVMNTETYYGTDSANVVKYMVSYEAELIKQCKSNNSNNQKTAPYDRQGFKVTNIAIGTTTIETKFVFTPPVKEQLNYPIITNTELSLKNGLYGVNIGSTYQQVIATFGDPSLVFSLFKGEVVIGYGRNHWLHFRADKLVKIHSKLSIISPTLSNKVPLRDFFDDIPWLIAKQIVRRSSFAAVKSALSADLKLNSKKQVVIKGQENSLILSFSYNKSVEDNSKAYTLDHFSLQANSYKEPSYQLGNRRESQFDILGLTLSQLNQEQVVDLQSLTSKLGQPIGRITLSVHSYIDIYNSSLLVEIKNSALASIQLLEQLFSLDDEYAKKTPWFIGDYIQGKSIAQLREYFPIDSFELDNTVQIEAEQFQLTLFFDDNYNGNVLYEVAVTLY
ncbi:hypothetical protein [Colwellia piezophila]|uniref:hypothetical protein n=1 Tax=Colwellia piezophila TaxID=211668 RepID=UPI00037AF89B|nr:hypothetical protein [Colwellia piezophila]